LNLILSLAGCSLVVLMAFIVTSRRKKEGALDPDRFVSEEEKQHRKNRVVWIVTSVVLCAAGVVVFLFTENINYLMVMADKWTVVNAVIFIALVLSVSFTLQKDTKNELEQ
jgi:hypothetical protein